MKLVVGLGNPGQEYDRTRHNVGFEVVDRLARRYADPAAGSARSRFSGLVVEAIIEGEKVLLLKPLTFMNVSGKSVAEAIRFYKMSPADDLLIVVDDTAIPAERPEGRCGHPIVRIVMEKFFEGTLRLFGSAGVDQQFRFRTQRRIGLRGGFDRPRQ